MRQPLLLLLFTAALAGCAAGGDRLGPPRPGGDRLCTPRAAALPPSEPAASPPETLARLAALGFSANAIQAAEVIGAAGPLRQLAEAGPAAAPTVRLRARQLVTDRILLAMLDVSSSLAALDCEGERGDQLRMRLEGRETRRAQRLGLASILAGAATAAATGGLAIAGATSAGNIAGILGGSGEASLAALLLFGESQGELRTPRNPLRDIALREPASGVFPPTVWRYLTRPRVGMAEQPSIAEIVVAEWHAAELLPPPGTSEAAAREALLFGAGGTYTVEALEARDAMLDLVEASVALMHRDLRELLEELLAHTGGATP